MSTERENLAAEQKVSREYGMRPERAAEVAMQLEKADDWYRFCKDGRRITGTKAFIGRKGACSE